MKTLVRVQNYREHGYNMKAIQVLEKRFKDSDVLDEIGFIKFQLTIGEDRWYGLKFEVSTDEVSKLQKMAKLAKFIKDNSNWDSQPDEILSIIGAVEYKVFNHEFVPVSKDGENIYDVVVSPGSLHSRIIAPNEIVAEKILKKRKVENAKLKFNCNIQL
jgi:hypothetical protein